jgi:hypothetical protein
LKEVFKRLLRVAVAPGELASQRKMAAHQRFAGCCVAFALPTLEQLLVGDVTRLKTARPIRLHNDPYKGVFSSGY